MNNKRKRWFQLSLITCIVLMFVAGGLVWLNVRKVETGECEKPENYWPSSISITSPAHLDTHGRGWPSYFQTYWRKFYLEPGSYGTVSEPKPGWNVGSGVHWERWPILYNILVALAILAGVGGVVEWVVRRSIMAGQGATPTPSLSRKMHFD